MRRAWQVFFSLGLLFFLRLGVAGGGGLAHGQQALSVHEEPERILLSWTGEVAPPMREKIAAALERYEDDPRRIVLSLNSPGGSVDHGRDVVATIHRASRQREIDTVVDRGSICASMCVPIFLVGAERSADPAARFMFHEASFKFKPGVDPRVMSDVRRSITEKITDDLFDSDMGTRSVDARWLENMRKKIVGRDVWLTGRQLMDQNSGVVDRLTEPRVSAR